MHQPACLLLSATSQSGEPGGGLDGTGELAWRVGQVPVVGRKACSVTRPFHSLVCLRAPDSHKITLLRLAIFSFNVFLKALEDREENSRVTRKELFQVPGEGGAAGQDPGASAALRGGLSAHCLLREGLWKDRGPP